MKRLFLLRHAKAGFGQTDHNRPLAPRGQKDSLWLGQYLKKSQKMPDHIYCSAAQRTLETASQIQAGSSTVITTSHHEDLYLASNHHIKTFIHNISPEIASAMIIGHNPGLSQLFQNLVATPPSDYRSLKYPTCTLAVLDFDVTEWAQIANHTGKLVKLIISSDQQMEGDNEA